MAVKIKINHDGTVDKPTFVLATKACRKLGVIKTTNEHFKGSFNSFSEISFTVNKQDVPTDIWEKTDNFKFVWCKEYDLWFEIYVELDESDQTIKNVTGKTVCESELSQTNLYNIGINTDDDLKDGVGSPLYNPSNIKKSILHRLIEKVPQYSIDHVDDTINGESKLALQRTFSFDGTSIYDAINEVCSEIKAIAIFGNNTKDGVVSRTINIYDLENYGVDTNIFVSTENLADDISYTTDVDSIKNCFRLVAGDDLMTDTIKNINPNGSNYIWNITEEMQEDMSEELKGKLAEYVNKYDSLESDKIDLSDIKKAEEYDRLIEEKYGDAYKDAHDDEPLNTIEELTDDDSQITGYSALTSLLYDVIDFKLFVQTEMAPEVQIPNASSAQEAFESLSSMLAKQFGDLGIGVSSINAISVDAYSVVSNAVLSLAKSFIDPRYDVEISDDSLTLANDIYTWIGSLLVKNKDDEEDYYTNSLEGFKVTGNLETYLRQK